MLCENWKSVVITRTSAFSGVFSIVSVLLAAGLFLILCITGQHRKEQAIRISVPLSVVSSLFGLLNTAGLCLYYRDTLPGFEEIWLVVVLLIVAFGWAVLFYLTSYWFLFLFDRKSLFPASQAKLFGFYDHHVFLCSAVLIALCWLPWILAYYPASMDNDVFYQLDMVMNYMPRTNHHPWLSSFTIGAFYRFGLRIHNENAGIFLFIIVRDFAMVLIYASCSALLRKMECPRWTYVLSTLFYAVTPVFGAYAKHAFKDTFGAAVFCLFILLLVDLLHRIDRECDDLKRYLFAGFAGLLAALSRNNYIYCLLPAAVLLLIYSLVRKRAVMKTVLFLVLILCTFAANYIAKAALKIGPTGAREALSLPLQQIGRVVAYHEPEISEEDRENLRKWLLNYDRLSEEYDPILSDPVKNNFIAGKEDTAKLIRVWAHLGTAFPKTYLEATVAHSSGYYAFTRRRSYDAGNWNANMTIFDWIGANAFPYEGLYHLHYSESTEKMRSLLSSWAELWDSLPLVSLTNRIPLYTWGTILIGFWLMKKKAYRDLIPVVSILICVLTCIASPVNDCFRYFAPVAAAFPALSALVFRKNFRRVKSEG